MATYLWEGMVSFKEVDILLTGEKRLSPEKGNQSSYTYVRGNWTSFPETLSLMCLRTLPRGTRDRWPLINGTRPRASQEDKSSVNHFTEREVCIKNFFLRFNFWERERDRAWVGEGQRERETPNRKQAPGSELSAQSPTRGSNPLVKRTWPEPKSAA